MYKRIAKGVAARHGLEATFMAKPFTGRAGSGLHLHVSVQDESGANIFASEDPAGTLALLEHEIARYSAALAEKPRRRMISATSGGTVSSQVSSPLPMRLRTSREKIERYLGL